MANRPVGYGLTADCHNKLRNKYSTELEQEARFWIEAVLQEPLAENGDINDPDRKPLGMADFHLKLKDGIILCKLAEAVTGNCKHNTSKMAFKQMENISHFLEACTRYGVAKNDLFQTVDLYENQNMTQVVATIHALGREAGSKGFSPSIGPKKATANPRQFNDDVLKAGESMIGLQMGTNKLASQSGMNFGKGRHINDVKVDDCSREGHGVIGLQAGTNRGASQKGYALGRTRGITAETPEHFKPKDGSENNNHESNYAVNGNGHGEEEYSD